VTARRALAAAALALTVAAGCVRSPEAAPRERAVDPQRVIALAPSVVELLYVLELGDRVVGVGNYCRYPPQATGKPKLGGLFDPHLEEITRLEPDLAILLPSEERLEAHLEALGIEVLTVPAESLDDIAAATLIIARRFSVDERGETFVRGWRDSVAPRPLSRRPRVLLAVSRQQGTVADTLSAGPGTFYHELLERMGAVNVFADAGSLYPQVSLEEAMQRLPEAIIDLRGEEPSAELGSALRADWAPLEGVPAIERDCYAVIGGDYVLLPGPRLPELYRRMRSVLEECGF